jgi:hypothetical protein
VVVNVMVVTSTSVVGTPVNSNLAVERLGEREIEQLGSVKIYSMNNWETHNEIMVNTNIKTTDFVLTTKMLVYIISQAGFSHFHDYIRWNLRFLCWFSFAGLVSFSSNLRPWGCCRRPSGLIRAWFPCPCLFCSAAAPFPSSFSDCRLHAVRFIIVSTLFSFSFVLFHILLFYYYSFFVFFYLFILFFIVFFL